MTNEYTYTVVIKTETKEQADQVLHERIGYDEDHGFPYSIEEKELLCP